MQIYGLFGQSGSGKSYTAKHIAEALETDWIIDDGLLIWRGHIIAGESAKFEKTKMGAVKRAIFTDPSHKEDVRCALERVPAEGTILVIGTSRKMIERICTNLRLTAPITWVPIEEMISREEISLAQNFRQYGMHAIPINETKIQETKMGRLLARIRFAPRPSMESQASLARTIVNPPFAGGAIHVHPRAIRDSILYLIAEQNHAFRVDKVSINLGDVPLIHLRVKAIYGYPIQDAAPKLLSSVRNYLSSFLGLSLVQVELVIVGLHFPAQD